MQTRTTLHFVCAQAAQKRTQLALDIAHKHDAILISEEELLSTMYPGESRLEGEVRLKQALQNLLVSSLKQGSEMVLNFSANTIEQRRWFRELIVKAEVDHQLHFVQSEYKNINSQAFEAPQKSEAFNVVSH